jgi:hypothetical protein
VDGMTEEEIFNLAAEIFQWVDDEGDIMEGVVTSEQVLEFATKVAQIAHAAGWGEGKTCVGETTYEEVK